MGRPWSTWLLLLALPYSGTTLEISSSMKILSEPTPVKDNLAECLLTIIRDPSLDFMVNIGVHIETESSFPRQDFTHTVERFMASNDRVAVYLGSVDGSNVQGRIYFVDSLKSLQGLVKRHREVDTDLSAGRQYYLVILPIDVKQPKRLMKQIFHFCWKESIVNVNILVGGKHGVVSLYTYFPFTVKSCEDYTPKIHNRFINGRFEMNKPIFPSKTSNLWQCPLMFVLYHAPPYEILMQDQALGFAIDIFTNLAKSLNYSCSSVISPNGRGEVYSNGTVTGSFKMLQDGFIDFLPGIQTATRFNHFATTNVAYIVILRLVIKEFEGYRPLEILLFPFDGYTWIALSMLFLIKWIVQLLWRRCRNRSTAPSVNFMRFSAMIWLFTMLVLSSSYGGSIFNFIHNPPTKPLPQNIDEAVDQDYKFVVSSIYSQYLSHISEIQNRIVEYGKSLSETFKFFDRLEGKYGFLIWETDIPEHIDYKKNDQYFVVPERIVTYPAFIYMQKFSHLAVEVSQQIDQMHAHGHILQSYRTHVPRVPIQKREARVGPESMPLEQLYGGFQIFCILIVISTFVFALELLAGYSRRLRIILEVFE